MFPLHRVSRIYHISFQEMFQLLIKESRALIETINYKKSTFNFHE